jgi:hypothetical protein
MTAPRLAIFHDKTSVSILQAFEAAHDWRRIVWIVGWSRDEPPIRELSRFGDVVDVTGMSEDHWSTSSSLNGSMVSSYSLTHPSGWQRRSPTD